MTCVYPGRFRTDFLDGSSVRYGEVEIEDYRGPSSQHRAALDADNHRQVGDPAKLAQAILTLCCSGLSADLVRGRFGRLCGVLAEGRSASCQCRRMAGADAFDRFRRLTSLDAAA